jgi:hypothetical protein
MPAHKLRLFFILYSLLSMETINAAAWRKPGIQVYFAWGGARHRTENVLVVSDMTSKKRHHLLAGRIHSRISRNASV